MKIDLILIVLCHIQFGLSLWWSTESRKPLLSYSKVCQNLRKKKTPLRIFCRKKPTVIMEIIRGAELSLHECGKQFQDQRFNCTMKRSIVKRILRKDTRETAILNAFVSAGIVHEISKACSRGTIDHCSCTTNNNKGFEWNGCSDNVIYGNKISRKILDSVYKNSKAMSDIKILAMLHNNEAGRRAVRGSMNRSCKCHGLSGSCHFQTCWNNLPSFQNIGKHLKLKYFRAKKVRLSNDGHHLILWDRQSKIGRSSLVYLQKSPNFCRRNLEMGSLGTRGRECNVSSPLQGNSCQHICCGRGYNTRLILVTERCDCKFEYCCKVTCQICSQLQEKTFCN